MKRSFERCLIVTLFATSFLCHIGLEEANAGDVNFDSFPVGTILDKQIPGVVFLQYKGRIRGIVADSPSGRIVSFSETVGCEFCPSGVNLVFSELQRTISVQVGLVPNLGPNIQRDLRLTAFNAAGNVLATATANVTAGSGFDTLLTVQIATPEIATVVIEAVDDPNMNAVIGMRQISFEDNPGGGGDFVLELPPGTSLLQGGPAVDVPLTIHRFSPSTGAIDFSFVGLPAGVTANVTPNPVFEEKALLRLKAASGPVPEFKTLVVTGTPRVATAGPGPRSASIDLSTTAQLQVTGPADVDFANCAPEIAHGTVNVNYWIIRDFRVAGPVHVALENLPPEVTGIVTPDNLTFPGWVIGQQIQVTLNTIAGPNIPDTWVPLHLTGPGVDMSFPILIHGTCPQQNRNFVIRGRFGYLNDQKVEPNFQPLRGAQVEIYRDGPDWSERVGETYTDLNGNFSMDFYASQVSLYHARLRLSSPEVNVIDADNSSVWSTDTERKTNRDEVIELGTLTISHDGGAGTPRAAVWQGFRDAAIEFQCTVGQPVPGGTFDVEIWRGHVTPLTFYDEVHWGYGNPTGENWNPYRGTRHEFAHIFRDVLDGGQTHWDGDNWGYVYGRSHDHCTGQVAYGISAHESGFAFHEGWAEYWSQDVDCCASAIGNQDIEGTVAHHLDILANCADVVAQQLADCPSGGRRGMVLVLMHGNNLIHSDADFRREFHLQYPHCVEELPSSCQLIQPAEADGVRLAFLDQTEANSPKIAAHTHTSPPDSAEQRKQMVAAIDAREKSIALLKDQQHTASGVRAFALQAAVEEGDLVLQRQRNELAEFDRGGPPERYLQQAYGQRRLRYEFVARRKAIQIRALRDALAVVPAEQRPELERRLLLLQESRIDDASLQSMISLPNLVGDDMIATAMPAHRYWIIWIVVGALAVIVVLLILFRRLR